MNNKAKIPTRSEFSGAAAIGAQDPTEVKTQPTRSGVKTQRSLRGATRKHSNGTPIVSIPRNPNPGSWKR